MAMGRAKSEEQDRAGARNSTEYKLLRGRMSEEQHAARRMLDMEFSVPQLRSMALSLADIEDAVELSEAPDVKLSLDGVWVRQSKKSPVSPAGIVIRKDTTVVITNGRMDWGHLQSDSHAFDVYGKLDLQGLHIQASGSSTLIKVHQGGWLHLHAVTFGIDGGGISVELRGGTLEGDSGCHLVGLDVAPGSLLPSNLEECSITGPITVGGALNATACRFLAGLQIQVTGAGKFVIEEGEFYSEDDDNVSAGKIVVQGGGVMDINADFSELETELCATVTGKASKLLLRRSTGAKDILSTRVEHGGQVLCV